MREPERREAVPGCGMQERGHWEAVPGCGMQKPGQREAVPGCGALAAPRGRRSRPQSRARPREGAVHARLGEEHPGLEGVPARSRGAGTG